MHRKINSRLFLILTVVVAFIGGTHFFTRFGDSGQSQAQTQSTLEAQKQKLNQLMSSFDADTPPDTFRSIIQEAYSLSISLLEKGHIDGNVTDAVYKTVAYKVKSLNEVLNEIRPIPEILNRDDKEALEFKNMLATANSNPDDL